MFQGSTSALAIAVTPAAVMASPVQTANEARYPDRRGQWARWIPPNPQYDAGNGAFTAGGQPSHDQTKPWGRGQDAPLTPEYQKVLENSLADQENGGEGNFFDHAVRCMPGGMPLITIAFGAMEYIVTPETTYIAAGSGEPLRRVFTDGRDWPTDSDPQPTFASYSIGRWIDEDSDGDEKRAGRSDRDTVDALVEKLFAVNPSKVRISTWDEAKKRGWLFLDMKQDCKVIYPFEK